jgi:hypothetical protein
LPRDAIDQFRVARPITSFELLAGDLIFTAPADRPNHIDHVMLYAGGENLIEATMHYATVREVSFIEKFGIPLENFVATNRTDEVVVYFGSCQLASYVKSFKY